MKPVSLINPPSEAEAQAIFDEDKGRCGTWRKHIFNLTRERRDAAVQQHRAARMLASGWRLSGVFRARFGCAADGHTGTDRALSGIQTTDQRANQVLDESVRRRRRSTTGSIRRRSRSRRSGTYGNSRRNAYDGPGTQGR